MKYRGAAAWLLASAGLFGWALAAGSDALGMVSFGAAGVGLALLAPAAKRFFRNTGQDSELEARVHALENRLRITEAELESASSEVIRLREERDFDRKLLAGDKTSDAHTPRR